MSYVNRIQHGDRCPTGTMEIRRPHTAGAPARPKEPNGSCSTRRRSGALPNRAHTSTLSGYCYGWLLLKGSTRRAPKTVHPWASADRPADLVFGDESCAWQPRKSALPQASACPRQQRNIREIKVPDRIDG